jgi:fucose permease
MHQSLMLLFALAAGLTLSGIAANLYRILARKPENAPERVL